MKKLIFFAIASAILLFSIIVVNIAPVINGLILESKNWPKIACSAYSDFYDESKKEQATEEELKEIKKLLNRCNRKQAMVGLEYVTSNLNIIFGFICALLGFLHFINVGNMGKYIGLIGLGAGAVGFVLTFVYVIESGLVFDDVAEDANGNRKLRIDSDGAFLKWNGQKYTCIFYDKDDEDSVYLKYSDYGKKFLSYNKELGLKEGDNKFIFDEDGCYSSTSLSVGLNYYSGWRLCKYYDELVTNSPYVKKKYYDPSDLLNPKGECDKLYYIIYAENNEKKIIYDRWLTTLILSCFIFLLNIGLAIFGFLLFRESGGSSGSVAIK